MRIPILFGSAATGLVLAAVATANGHGPRASFADTAPDETHSEEFDILQYVADLRASSASAGGGRWARELTPGERPVQEYQLSNPKQRWGGLANLGDPITITWSLAPDGTQWLASPPTNNILTQWMDGPPANGPVNWRSRIDGGFQRWEDLTGIDFVQVDFQNGYDDGAAYGAPGAPGLRGDIRIFLVSLPVPGGGVDGMGGTLAIAEPPDGIAPAPSGGEITFDAEDWAGTPWLVNFGFDRAIMHEIGHAIGLVHSCPGQLNQKLMQPFASTMFYGPQHDDIRGAQELYGDPFEPNDSREEATYFDVPFFPVTLGEMPDPPYGPPIGPFEGGLHSIDPNGDVDWFTFTLLYGRRVTLTLQPIGGVYQDSAEIGFSVCPQTSPFIDSSAAANLDMQVWRQIDKNDQVLIATANTQLAGSAEVLSNLDLVYPGTYFIRVSSTSMSGGTSQLYELSKTGDFALPCSGDPGCSDGISFNGSEFCDPWQQNCVFEYWDDDLNYDSIPDSLEVLADCNGNGRPDVGEIAQSCARAADDCLNAQPIESGVSYEYTTVYAHPDGQSINCIPGTPDVWYRYTPMLNGPVTVTTCGSRLETSVAVYFWDPGLSCDLLPAPSPTFCSDFGLCNGLPAYNGEVTFEATAGEEYLIRVAGSGFSSLGAGDFQLMVQGPEDVTNDCNGNGLPDDCEVLVDCNGNGVADECEMSGLNNYCHLNPNSATPGARVSATGSLSFSANSLQLHLSDAPPFKAAVFFFGQNQASNPPPFSSCLLSPTARVRNGMGGLVYTDMNGEASITFDFTAYPDIPPLLPGSTWSFQAWFRDPGGPAPTDTNYSDVLELTFCN